MQTATFISSAKYRDMLKFVVKMLAVFLFTLMAGRAFSQDLIYTTKGPEIKCKVMGIKGDSINYNETPEVATGMHSIKKKDVVKIKYANGYEDFVMNSIVKTEPVVVTTTPAPIHATTNSTPATVIPIKSTAVADPKAPAAATAETMNSILENWKHKYTAPPLEVF